MKKNCLIFQTANRVLFDKLLDISYMFRCFESSPAYKDVFFIKNTQTFFFFFLFNDFLWTSKFITVWKTLILYVEFTKKLIIFSFFSPQFFIRKCFLFINVAELFSRGDNSLRRTYIKGAGLYVKQTGTKKTGGSKIRNFEQTYFLNVPCLERYMF